MPGTVKHAVYILACGALAEEILFLKRALGADAVTLECLPAILHNRPEKIAPALREKLNEVADKYQKIFIGYADCGTGGAVDKICEEFGAERLPGPHCYAFYSGTEKFLAECEQEIDVFYLTDFLARHFDNFVTEPLGLDKHPELRDDYFQHYRKLVYLAQTDNPELTERAARAASFLRLNFERRFTGYGELSRLFHA